LALLSAQRAEWHGKEYREMVRRMGHTGEMVAYAAQRVTVAVLGILIIFAGQFMTTNDPPAIVQISNLLALIGGGALIAYTGEELIRLSDFERWKADRIVKVRKQLKRACLTSSDIDAECGRLTGE
jgi:hypothetical protein